MNLNERIKAYHFYLDYLRSHELLKQVGAIGRDRKMISWEDLRTRNHAFETVCGRLLRAALGHYFKGWEVKKSRNDYAYYLGSERRLQYKWNYETRRNEPINQIDPAKEDSKYHSIIFQREDGVHSYASSWKYVELRNKLGDICQKANEIPHKAEIVWTSESTPPFLFKMNSETCGLYRIISLLPELRMAVDEALIIANDRVAWEEERKRKLVEKQAKFNKFMTMFGGE